MFSAILFLTHVSTASGKRSCIHLLELGSEWKFPPVSHYSICSVGVLMASVCVYL